MAPRPVLRPLALVALLVGLAALVTYPQVRQIGTGVNDFGDPLLNAWALAWTAHILPVSPASLFDANIFYPERGTLALSETLVFPALLVAPLRWLGLNPIALHNVTLLAGYALSGLTMFALVRQVTGQPWAAVVSAVIFTTSPLRTDHFPTVQLQQTYLMPLALLQIHRIAGGARGWKPAVLLGLTVAAQFASCVYYTVYFVTVLPVLTLLLLLLSRQAGRRSLAQLAIAALLAGAVIAVFLPAYLRNRDVVGERAPRELVAGSAELRDYRRAHPQNLVHGRRGFDWPGGAPAVSGLHHAGACGCRPRGARGARRTLRGGSCGRRRFLARRERSSVSVVLRLSSAVPGPSRAREVRHAGGDVRVGPRGPWRGVGDETSRGRRTSGTHFVADRHSHRDRGIPEPAVRAADDAAEHPGGLRVAACAPPGVVVEYPVGGLEGRIGPQDPTYMYYSTAHWKPLLNGYSGFAPPSYSELLDRMRDFPSTASIDYLRAREAKYLLVHSAYYINGGFEQDAEALGRLTGLRRVAQFRTAAFGDTDVYEITR